MSFILKALQKIEEENAARSAEPPAMENAILSPHTRPEAAKRRTLKWLAILLVFLAGGAMAYLVMPKGTFPSVSRKHMAVSPSIPAMPAPSASQVAPTTPSIPVIPTTSVAMPATPAAPAAPVTHADILSARPVPAVGGNSSVAGSDNGRQAARRGTRPRITEENPSTGAPAVAVPPSSATAADAPSGQLTVNGIAFQDDPGASAAVVNGVFVKRGMMVGGARVDRIFQDKVRFSRSGTTFEVPLAK